MESAVSSGDLVVVSSESVSGVGSGEGVLEGAGGDSASSVSWWLSLCVSAVASVIVAFGFAGISDVLEFKPAEA